MRVLEDRYTGVLIPIGYSGYDGFGAYGEFGKWGLAKAWHKITHGVKKVVTSKPFKIAAGVTLAAVALPHIAATASTVAGAASGAAGTAGTVAAGAGAIGAASQILSSPVGQAAIQYGVQHQLQKEQYKQQKKLIREQQLAQLEAQKKALEQQLRAQQLSLQQQLEYMKKLQEIQAQILKQRMALAQLQAQSQLSQPYATRGMTATMATQKKDDFMKYALLGGGALLILMLAMNRG